MAKALTDLISLETLDVDGALRESAESVGTDTRAGFFRKAGIAGGSLAAGSVLMGGLPGIAYGKASARQDTKILNYALTLEYLEAAFYNQAVANIKFRNPAVNSFAEIVKLHENAHVDFLKSALGGDAVASPRFDFKDTVTNEDKFVETATVLEDTGVRAYLGQVHRFKATALLRAAGSILTVEARHAGAIRQIRGFSLTPTGSFDKPASRGGVLAAVGATGFIVG